MRGRLAGICSFNSSTNFSCQALAECLRQNSALRNLNLVWNGIDSEGAKAWCLVWMVWRRGKQAAGFHRKDHTAMHLKVKSVKCWKDLKGMQSVVLHSFTMFSIVPAKRDLKILTTGGGTPRRRYIGPQRWYKVCLCPFADLRSHTKWKLPLSDLEDFECVLSNQLTEHTEHISGTYADAWWFWFFTGCLWWSDWLGCVWMSIW